MRTRRLLDVGEQIAASLLYAWFVWRLWPDYLTGSSWYPLLLVVSDGIVVVLLIIRRPTDRISTSWRDWAIAAAGTFLALLVGTTDRASLLGPAGVLLMLLGLSVHVGAKLSLRRSFGLVAADRGVKVGGLYRVVRHPMYAGYILAHIGFLLVEPSLRNLALYLVAWSLLVARIYAEERMLGEDPEYRAFQAQVRYRLLPGLF